MKILTSKIYEKYIKTSRQLGTSSRLLCEVDSWTFTADYLEARFHDTLGIQIPSRVNVHSTKITT